MLKILHQIGEYSIFISKVFRRPEKWKVFRELFVQELWKLGIGSIGIIVIISGFMGMVITIQTASQIDSGWIPAYLVGYTTRQKYDFGVFSNYASAYSFRKNRF